MDADGGTADDADDVSIDDSSCWTDTSGGFKKCHSISTSYVQQHMTMR